jgi:uncharacterized protein YcbX
MAIELGRIHAIFRYPVKSMAGEETRVASLGWHGLEGDRRYAFRRVADPGGFPWLTASRLPELLLFKPLNGMANASPAQVRTPEGRELELCGEELRAEISHRHGAEVQLMQFKHGIFDEASISIISLATIRRLEQEAGRPLEIQRFRPNLVIETVSDEPFGEDNWVGKSLVFGAAADAPAVNVIMRDERCVMVNFDPQTAEKDPRVMKAAIKLNENNAGVYCTVISTGEISVGQTISFR